MHFTPTSASLSSALVAFSFISQSLAHNFVTCTNTKPDLDTLLSKPKGYRAENSDTCGGYGRATPADGTNEAKLFGDQGFPWQGIWPLQDGIALRNHRSCNWLQENPVYDPKKKWSVVKPGATIMVLIATNNHAHEYAQRQSGHYKIYLAGGSGTQIKTADQLTDDRVVFKAPANKYAHITGTPNFAGYDGDPGYAWLPFKLVDPKGAYLPPGVYNFVWTYWWSTGEGDKVDYMIPAYSSCFDIEIREDAEDAGFLTQKLAADPKLHVTLIGNSSSPGSKDLTSPWPPYPAGYLTSNYDGVDPNTPIGQRTFQPYWTAPVPANPAPAPSLSTVKAIKTWSEQQLEQALPLTPASQARWFTEANKYPKMAAGEATGGMKATDVTPSGVNGTSSGATNTTSTGMEGEGGYESGGYGGETPPNQTPKKSPTKSGSTPAKTADAKGNGGAGGVFAACPPPSGTVTVTFTPPPVTVTYCPSSTPKNVVNGTMTDGEEGEEGEDGKKKPKCSGPKGSHSKSGTKTAGPKETGGYSKFRPRRAIIYP